MRVLQKPTELITKLGDNLRPKTEAEKRAGDITALILAIGAALALLYTLLPK